MDRFSRSLIVGLALLLCTIEVQAAEYVQPNGDHIVKALPLYWSILPGKMEMELRHGIFLYF